jgi:hypothetical protein
MTQRPPDFGGDGTPGNVCQFKNQSLSNHLSHPQPTLSSTCNTSFPHLVRYRLSERRPVSDITKRAWPMNAHSCLPVSVSTNFRSGRWLSNLIAHCLQACTTAWTVIFCDLGLREGFDAGVGFYIILVGSLFRLPAKNKALQRWWVLFPECPTLT